MITRSVLLRCSPEEAFRLFTEEASGWWPQSRRHTADPASRLSMLPSGRFWERAADGKEVELGRVLVWEPPRRLVLDFYPGTDPDHPTEVTVLFTAESGGTRVLIEHRPKPESEDLWKQRAERFERSWDAVLEALSKPRERTSSGTPTA